MSSMYEPGQMLCAEWDGDGTWRIVRVVSVEGEQLDVDVYAERYDVPPDHAAVDALGDDAAERHQIERDELAQQWPLVIEPPPEAARSTRRGLLEGLLRSGVERGEQIARRRRPPWS